MMLRIIYFLISSLVVQLFKGHFGHCGWALHKICMEMRAWPLIDTDAKSAVPFFVQVSCPFFLL